MTTYNDAWVETHIRHALEAWHNSANAKEINARIYLPGEQQERERAYDEALEAAESDALQPGIRDRLVATFGIFAAHALDLDGEAINLLTQEFLPVGTALAQWARRLDPDLGISEIIQAARNAWTACGMQPLLGMPVALTPSIFGYSLMYPYSDNYLDDESIPSEDKRHFCQRFRQRLLGDSIVAANHRECAIWKLVDLVEMEYPRAHHPWVFECLLAIHQAQEHSLRQQQQHLYGDYEVLHTSCAKGGTSVLTDACLARGWLSKAESAFAFEWGVLLQLGDDLQDVQEDLRLGSTTLFTRNVAAGKSLDEAALQLLSFSEKVGRLMDELPNGSASLKRLLKMSWRSLITRAIADSHEFFSQSLLIEAERTSPFRFEFLRKRSRRLASRQGLYACIIEGLIETQDHDTANLSHLESN